MANTVQARKRARQAIKRRALNFSQRSELRTAIKSVRKAIASGDKAAAQSELPSTYRELDVAVRKGVIPKARASRLKARSAKGAKAATKS